MEIIKSNVEEAREYFKQFEFKHLRTLQAVLSDEIRLREKEAVSAAKAEISKIAEQMGMSVQALMSIKTPKPAAPAGPKSPKSPGAGIYRHPENPMLEWKGMGKHPLWLKELLANGATFESLRIAA